ncbi:hypothetical protein COCNU_07G007670 [Cocos nucifera]|uniref:Uncharacterized protein n=1 Tax=Cocos nucifera TaxID=13894 RepID=A0A8K0IEW6_COCNU|nr:hypothetical protein COCNU_07G007670 [Cocos nucifera]
MLAIISFPYSTALTSHPIKLPVWPLQASRSIETLEDGKNKGKMEMDDGRVTSGAEVGGRHE